MSLHQKLCREIKRKVTHQFLYPLLQRNDLILKALVQFLDMFNRPSLLLQFLEQTSRHPPPHHWLHSNDAMYGVLVFLLCQPATHILLNDNSLPPNKAIMKILYISYMPILISWSKVLLEMLTVTQLLKSPAFN